MSNNSRTANSIRNIATGFLGQFITTILGFISRTVFIKCLAEEYLGVNGLFSNILSMLSLAELGIGTAIIYALYKPLAEKDEDQIAKLMNFYSKTYTAIGIFIFVTGILLMPFLNFIIGETPTIKESIYVIYTIYLFNTSIGYFYSYKSSLIIADQKNYVTLLISYGVTTIQTILQICVLLLTKNFLVYLMVQSICVFINNLLISITANKMYPFLREKKKLTLNKDEKQGLVSNVKALVIVKISGILVNNTDNIIMTYFNGLKSVALCSNYTLLIGIINTALNQIFSGITASVGNFNAMESKERKEEFFNIINFCNFWLYGFCSICIVILINDVITLWIGREFILDSSIPIILAINFYMVGMQSAVGTYRATIGIFREGRYLLLITAGLNLILSIYLGDELGVFGILLATTISRVCTNIWFDPYIVYKIGFKKNGIRYLFKYLEYILVLFIAGGITCYLCELVINESYIGLLMKLIICLIIPNIIILVFYRRKKEFIYLWNCMSRILGNIFILDKA